MQNGTLPEPGSGNRFVIQVTNIKSLVNSLINAGVQFRSNIIEGVGGRQCLVENPSGNPVELFQPIIPEERLDQESLIKLL